MNVEALALPILSGSGVYLAWSDIARRRLPNVATAVLGGAGLLAAFAAGGSASLGAALVHAFAALVVGFGLFTLNLAGSGDAKYYAAVAAWFPSGRLVLLGWISLAAFVVALAWLVWQRLASRKPESGGDFAKVPFGVAIAAGSVAAALVAVS